MKLTIIGGGSVRTPQLIPALVRRAKRLDLQEVWLMDIDGPKLDLIGALCRTLLARHGEPFRLLLTTDAREAIRGAAHIITSIRPGFEQGRATDERIALNQGVLGQETTGAAGFAMAMRSLPAILEYCQIAAEVSPGAWVYNFTNPAGLVAQGLHYAGIERVVGICDSANGAQHATARHLGITEGRVRHTVFGLNHLSWTRSVKIDAAPDDAGSGGEEVLPALLNDPRFIASTHMNMFDPGLVSMMGAWMNEYLHYFYYRDQALAALLEKPETRGEETLRLTAELLNRLRDTPSPEARLAIYHEIMDRRSATYMAHAVRHDSESEVATSAIPAAPAPAVPVAPVTPVPAVPPDVEESIDEGYAGVALGCVESIATGMLRYTGLNVPNRGAIPAMRDDDVVEVTCVVDSRGPRPLPMTDIPEAMLGLMQTVKQYERLAARAILSRSRALATEALMAHPLIGCYPVSRALVAAFIAAHRDLVGDWK